MNTRNKNRQFNDNNDPNNYIQKLSDSVYFVEGSDYCSNIYILDDGEVCIIVDTGDGSRDVEQLTKGLSGRGVDCCILTHGHLDHTSGTTGKFDCFLMKEDFRNEFPFFVPPHIKPLNFSSLKKGSFNLEIIHTPGHTKGSICIFEKNRKILFSGDTLFSDGWIGRTDFPGGSEEDMMRSLELLLSLFSKKKKEESITIPFKIPFDIDELELDITFLCSGHGEPKRI
jgi:glyoxylase-like metal-dependent hydrolase (beta-lactamase superfamily II)